MDKIYYNPSDSGSFGGVKRLQHRSKQPNKVKNWLTYQDAYTLHKPVRKKFTRRRVLVGGIDDQWQCDLVDLTSISHLNDQYKFLLTCIDVLSKYAWVVPIKNKSADSLVSAMKKIFTESSRKPNKIQGDKGREFLNRKFLTFLKENNVHFFSTENDDIKASIVERWNRTLKSRMWRYFTYTRNKRYIDNIQKFVDSYNNSKHRTIQMAPGSVRKKHELKLLKNMYELPVQKKHNSVFNIGDTVRIAMTRRPFRKGYTAQWSEELFKITQKIKSFPVTYKVIDLMDEHIDGTFYPQELQLVGVKKNKVYSVENVLKTRKRGGKTEYFVKWKGYGPKFNSWVLKDDVIG